METYLITRDEYHNICTTTAGIPIFLQDWWMEKVCKNWRAVVVKKKEKVVAVWPFPVENKIGVSILRTPFLTPYLGPHIIIPEGMREGKTDNYEREATSLLLQQIPYFKVWELALQPGFKQAGAFKNAGFDIRVKQTFLMDLREDENLIFSGMHEDSRRNINRTDVEMVITHEPELLPLLFEFQKKVLDNKRVKMPYTLLELQSLFNACAQHNQTALWVARKEGTVQGILWNLWDDVRSYYLVGAKNPLVKDNRAITALIWHSIKHCKALDKKSFDFEGSMVPGVERFFSSFGARKKLYLIVKKNDSLLWKLIRLLRK